MPSSARDVENNGEFGVVKTESDLLNLGHDNQPYKKPNAYSFHCFGCCHGGYGSTHQF